MIPVKKINIGTYIATNNNNNAVKHIEFVEKE